MHRSRNRSTYFVFLFDAVLHFFISHSCILCPSITRSKWDIFSAMSPPTFQTRRNRNLQLLYRAHQKNLSTPFNWRWRRKTYELAVAHIIKNVRQTPVALPYKLNVAALRRHTLIQPPEWEAIYTLDLRNLRHIKLRQGLTKCRDRHGRAWPIICVPFWAITSSLCVSISIFVSPSLFFLITAPTLAST